MHSITINKWKNIEKITTKDIYLRLLSSTSELTETEIFQNINKKHKVNISSVTHLNPFNCIKSITKDVKLQNVQYKLVHNVYPTMYHLHKWKIRENPRCANCMAIDDLKHSIYECSFAKQTLANFKEVIKEKLGLVINLTYTDVLLGLSTNRSLDNYNVFQKKTVDKLLIIIKRSIILQREIKRVINKQELIDLISYQYHVEEASQNSLTLRKDLHKQWGSIKLSERDTFSYL